MVYLILADGFEEIEALAPVDILRRGGIDIKTVSIMSTNKVIGAHNIPVMADIMIQEVNPADMEMLILPGGGGHTLLDASNEVHSLINYCLVHNLYIAAICASPSILGKKQILDGKNATCYPGFEKYCYGAKMKKDKVVTDGKIITGRGPGAASEFGFEILSILKGNDAANKLKDDMQYND